MILRGFGGYTHGCASAPPRNGRATRREESPTNKHQPLRVPNRYHRRGSGATVGDSHKGPLITGENPLFRKIVKHRNTPRTPKARPEWSRPKSGKAHDPKRPQRPTNRSAVVPLG
jgi:hypothetical protein